MHHFNHQTERMLPWKLLAALLGKGKATQVHSCWYCVGASSKLLHHRELVKVVPRLRATHSTSWRPRWACSSAQAVPTRASWGLLAPRCAGVSKSGPWYVHPCNDGCGNTLQGACGKAIWDRPFLHCCTPGRLRKPEMLVFLLKPVQNVPFTDIFALSFCKSSCDTFCNCTVTAIKLYQLFIYCPLRYLI